MFNLWVAVELLDLTSDREAPAYFLNDQYAYKTIHLESLMSRDDTEQKLPHDTR